MHVEARQNAFATVIMIGFLMLGFLPIALHPATAAATKSSALGLMIPLYAYPTDPSWSGLISAKESYPSVPIVAVISPTSSGPGGSYDPNFASGIAALHAAGITVLGYIDTQYTGQSLSSVESWTSEYLSWYNVDGIFFDCMSNTNGDQSYYSSAASYAESLGLTFNVGNPGTSTLSSYVGIDNVLVIYENPGLPSLSTLQSAAMGDSSSNFAFMAYATSLPSQSFLSSASQYASWVYVTDAGGSDPYQSLPSYMGSLMSMLSSIDNSAGSSGTSSTTSVTSHTTATTTTTTSSSTKSTTSSSSTSGGGTSSLHVNSVNSFGNTVDGYYTDLYNSGGTSVATGYTPSVFTLTNGAGYQIQADASYGGCTFSHWTGAGLTGSTQNPASIKISSPTTLTAVYSGSGCGPQTSNSTTTTTTSSVSTSTSTTTSTQSTSTTKTTSTATSSGGQGTVVVNAVDQNGNPLSGYWTVLYSSSGSQVSTGYTPKTFSVQAGTSYQLELDGYGSCSFANWQGTSNSGHLSFTATSGQQTFTGVYTCK